jgi:membrane-associated phospholipid phosphatase
MGVPTFTTPVPAAGVLRRLPRVLLPAGALLPLTYFVPGLNPFTPPHLDLTGPFALAAYWVAQSAGTTGAPLVGLVLTAVLVSRPGIPGKQRALEICVIGLALAALWGAGAYVNEHVVKPAFAVPRPNILELAREPPEGPALKMSAEAFYALPDKRTRTEYLRGVLTPEVRLHERVREHWLAETGYSFPSGHSFSAMLCATFFLAMGLSHFSGRRLWVFYLLVPWAVAVCFSRPILRVHSPTDICAGGLEGIVAATLTFLLVRATLAVLRPGPAALSGEGRPPEEGFSVGE